MMGGNDTVVSKERRRETILNGILLVLILVATASVGFAFMSPQEQGFTEFFLLTENESGDLVAADYPKQFVSGGSGELIVGITNRENERTAYTVVVQLHRVIGDGDSDTVVERESLEQFEAQLEDGETWQRQHTVTPTMIGDRLRLTYLLYRDEPPETPTVGSSYRETHIWINVTPG
jgi:uncharacterized membrane protein